MDGYSGSYINYPDTDNAVNRSYSDYLSRWYDEKEKALPEQNTSSSGSSGSGEAYSSQISQVADNRAQTLLQSYLDRAKSTTSTQAASPTTETSGTTSTSTTTSSGSSSAATGTGGSSAAQDFATRAKEAVKGMMRTRSGAAPSTSAGDDDSSEAGGQTYQGAWGRLAERYPDMPTGDRKASMEYLRSKLPDDVKGKGIGYFMRRQWGDDHPGRGRGRDGAGSSGGSTGGSGGSGGGTGGGGGNGSTPPAAPAPVYTAPVAAGRDTAGGGERNDIPDHMKRARHPQMPDMSSYSAPRPRYDAPTGRGYENPTVSRNGRF